MPQNATTSAAKTAGKNMAAAIFRAFKAYKTEVEQKSSFHLATNDVKPQPVPRPVEETIENNTQPTVTEAKATKENDLFYSVQIAALKKKLDTTPENFEGLTDVFREDAEKLSRYFFGEVQKPERGRSATRNN